MTGRARRRLAAGLLALAGLVDAVLAAVPTHALRLGWDAVPAYGWHRYALTAAGVACLTAAPAVARGRREARWAGVSAAAISMLIAVLHDADLLAFVPSGVAFGALLAAGKLPGRADPLLARRGLRMLIVGEAAVFLYAAAGLFVLDANFLESTSLVAALREALRLVFLLPASAIEPATKHGAWFLDSVRWMSVLVLGMAFLRMLAPSLARDRRRHEAERAQGLLERWGNSSLAPFLLLDDKYWCFSEDGGAFVGYALSGQTAIALGGPVGAPAARMAAVRAFLDLCERQAWAPAFHQVDDADAEMLRGFGLHLVKVGEEAVIDVTSFSLAGGAMKPIRQAVGRAEREGLTVIEPPLPLDDAALAELRAVSDAWLSTSGHRERGFTLGTFDPEALSKTPVLLVHDHTGRPVAFANVIPCYEGSVGNFDLMRRVPDAPNGAMELLFVKLIERFRAEGLNGMSLGMAPLAGVQDDGGVARLLGAIRERSGFMNFSGLQQFKGKWRPRWEPRYFAYAGPADLPRAAAATALAGERPGRGPATDAGGRLARRFPVSIVLSAAILWFMAATAGDPTFHATLVDQLALSWPDITSIQWWRIPLSSLVQEDVGIRWSIFLLLPALPVAEARLGWRRTLLVFFVSDAFSSVPTLAISEIVGAAGSSWALEPNLGSSSGLVGLLGAWVASLPAERRRSWAVGMLVGALAVGAAIERDLASVQHVVAAAVGAGLLLILRRRRSPR